MSQTPPNLSNVQKAVASFDNLYSDMEKALWGLSKISVKSLQSGVLNETEALIWTLKSWWGVQGVKRTTAIVMSQLIGDQKVILDLHDVQRTGVISANDAATLVIRLVREMRDAGVPRNEISLTSKTLHWLLPWHVPPYDSYIRKYLGLGDSLPFDESYRALVNWHYNTTQSLSHLSKDWIGSVPPRSPLRALDKYLWYEGGGYKGTATVVMKPLERIANCILEIESRDGLVGQ